MKNSLNRYVPKGFKPYVSSDHYKQFNNEIKMPIERKKPTIEIGSLEEIIKRLNIKDGMTISFHHHLRNGDYVLNDVTKALFKTGVKNITLAPSSIFPIHAPLVEYIKSHQITKIYTDYLNGAVSDAVQAGHLKELLIMQTHGGRPRAIEQGELEIDVAFIAASCVDRSGYASGKHGKSAFGSIGYAIPDALYAKKVVLVTDNLVDTHPSDYDIDGKYVDYIITRENIGDQKNIVSGTTMITKDPIGLKIAKDAATVLDKLGMIKEGFSMQTGAGGVSLAVAKEIRTIMENRHITGSFVSGGITGYFVTMLENHLIEALYDVQCFDLWAVYSSAKNDNHYTISASKYANAFHKEAVVDNLDIVILGATEIDVDFNVNVTTDSYGKIIGGSGGHADAANGAKLTVIVTQLVKTRIPIIKEKVTTITTPGEDIDILVTDRGIAINPKRTDLIEKLSQSNRLNIMTINELKEIAHKLTGVPRELPHTNEVVGVVEYRDGTIIDSLYKPYRKDR